MWRIEPVPSRCRQEALRFLVGGEAGAASASQVAALAALTKEGTGNGSLAGSYAFWKRAEAVSTAGRPDSLWWAWNGRAAAVAMVTSQPGRTGFLLHCPLEAPGVDAAALAEVVRAATGQALRAGLQFVQVSMLRDGQAERQATEAWGYRFVAELFYMTLDLNQARQGSSPAAQGEGLTWRGHGQFTEAELGELILATYEGSQDCPILLPLRPAADVLASHKAGGAYRPESWWILDVAGRPAGCVLANDRPLESAAEVEYLGLLPASRGRGLARLLIERAASDAAGRGLGRLLLACDSRNARALRAYARAGFCRTHSRWIFAAIRA